MPVAEIVQLLRETIGLDPDSIGQPTVERAIQERQTASGLGDVRAYATRVSTSKDELQALVEAVVVPETWFFRDPGAFDALSAVVRHGALPMATEPLRLLSLPSSTGEEPYSMAMALLDAGVPSARFQVDAMDVSRLALERAAAAVYGRNSFRGGGTLGRDHHFETAPGGRRVCDRVRRQVRFRHGNLLASPFVAGRDRFDIIFCRNLLIYFDRATQDRAIDGLGALLKPDGLLFVGSSEGGLALSHGYVSARLPMAFAFRRAETARPQRPSPARILPVAILPPLAPKPQPHAMAAPPAIDLAVPSADAFCRLAVEQEAQGSLDDAESSYRKALYLDPRHQDAVTRLALLVERRGGDAEAKVLWNRARRLAGGNAR